MAKSPDRHIPFEGAYNFRDLGGYRTTDGKTVKWRRLFRSDDLRTMTEADAARARELGVATVIDLREAYAGERDGDGPLAEPPVRYVSMPLVSDSSRALDKQIELGSLAAFYLWRLGQPAYGRRLVELIELISEPGVCPAVFHCTAGKDRTGVLAAMTLGVLGVEDDDIVRDYAMTDQFMPKVLERSRTNPNAEATASQQTAPSFTKEARAETMRAMLDGVKAEHGSVRAYLEKHGLDNALLQRLEDTLLE